MRYLVTGTTILNDMQYADGSTAEGFLGGAIYAAAGIRPYCDEVLVVTTAGPDFDTLFGPYYRRNGLSTAGVQVVLPKTQYTILEYAPDGRWWEYSKYGPEYEQTWSETTLIRPEYVTRGCDATTRGIYFESGAREPVWRGLAAIRAAAPNASLMWEIPTGDALDPAAREIARDLIEQVDLYSLNLPEALAFFGAATEEEAIAAILALGKPCFFRVGEKGAWFLQAGRAWFAPAYGLEQSVDPTGCGNCSTGAALYGFCEGLHPLKSVILANLAAALNARQFGPYPHFTPALRIELLERAEAAFQRRIEE